MKTFDFSKNHFFGKFPNLQNFRSRKKMFVDFWKHQNLMFSKKNEKLFFRDRKFWKFENFPVIFWKNQKYYCLKLFFEKIFSENRVVEKQPQKVFGCNFSKNEYFYLNPKAYEAAWPWLSFPLLGIKNGPLHKKLSRLFVRVTV